MSMGIGGGAAGAKGVGEQGKALLPGLAGFLTFLACLTTLFPGPYPQRKWTYRSNHATNNLIPKPVACRSLA